MENLKKITKKEFITCHANNKLGLICSYSKDKETLINNLKKLVNPVFETKETSRINLSKYDTCYSYGDKYMIVESIYPKEPGRSYPLYDVILYLLKK